MLLAGGALAQEPPPPPPRVALGVGGAQAARLAHAMAETRGLPGAVGGLDMPADVAAAAPEVESLLARALKESAGAHKAVLAVEAGGSRARVSLDGRAGLCVTPCSLDVPPGDHVVAIDADGALPA